MEKQWDNAAIDGVYDHLIEKTGELLDFIGVHGLGFFFSEEPVLTTYLKLVESIERELLIQWKIKSEEGLDVLFLRQKKWLRENLRRENSIFEYWGKLVRELSVSLTRFSAFSEGEPWTRFLTVFWLDQENWRKIGWGLGDDHEKVKRVCDGFMMLKKLEPFHLILSFLNLVELGCGNRPEILPLVSSNIADKKIGGDQIRVQNPILDKWSGEESFENFSQELLDFWKKNSGGIYSQFPAFVLNGKDSGEEPLRGVIPKQRICLEELVGIDSNIKKLKVNTENFLNGNYAHHVLLWGGRGTGKSSCVLALLEEYVDWGIRLIEMPLSKLNLLPKISQKLAMKKEKFILFCDDLSFDNGDDSYKHLKSLMDGSVLSTAENILLIATSNRKDLVFRGEQSTLYVTPEEKQQLDEKRAIDDRFGLKLFFDVPVFKDLKAILFYYADKTGLEYNKDKLFIEFRQFAQKNNHDKPAGRTVKQFISAWADQESSL